VSRYSLEKHVRVDTVDGEDRQRDAWLRTRETMPTNQQRSSEPTAISSVQFLTVAEVAKMMRVSKMTVYRLVHSGDLPAVRVGKSFRVPEQAVHTYLENAYFDAG
jgi:excisionase family DNA binding protein